MIVSSRKLMEARGFALMTVLWAMLVASLVAIAAVDIGRLRFEGSRNRLAATRAYWRAQECAERARARIDEMLRNAGVEESARRWRHLDRAIQTDALAPTGMCDVRLEPAGQRLDVNTADRERLRALFGALNRQDGAALTDAVLDWRDSDQDPQPEGAERPWYVSKQRVAPRDGPFADTREIALVRGMSEELLPQLGVDGGRVPINSAPPSVLATVPGFSPAVVQAIVERRERGEDVLDILALAVTLPRDVRDELTKHYPEISQLTAVDPEAWLLTASCRSGAPAVESSVEVMLVRGARDAVVRRRRTW